MAAETHDRTERLRLSSFTLKPPATQKILGYRQCTPLVRFECNFLREHNVSGCQRSFRHETPTDPCVSLIVKLENVGGCAIPYSVSFAGLASNDIKIPVGIELS